MEGCYFVRRKSSLAGKRFRKDPAFTGSRRSAALLQRASPLASRLYRRLPGEMKGRDGFRALTGKVKLLLAEEWNEEQIGTWFEQRWLAQPAGEVVQPGCVEPKNALRFAAVAMLHPAPAALSRLPTPVSHGKK